MKRLKQKRFAFVIPIMIGVTIIAIYMLNGEFSEIPMGTRLMIAIGAGLLSGLISYFLFPEEEGKKRR